MLVNSPKRKWWLIAATASSMAISFIDQTAIAVALPSIQHEFQISATALQWIINAYLLVLAALIIIGGRLGDIFQHRNAYLIGMIIFLIASIACGFAPNEHVLIIGRAIQGIGSAIFIPCSSVIVRSSFPREEQGKSIGMVVGLASIFLAAGPFIGGLLTQILNWRLIFWVNIPFSLFSLMIIYLATEHVKSITQRETIDWFGAITLAITISAIVIILMDGNNIGWSSPTILFLFILALIAGTCFFFREKSITYPIIDLKIFRDPIFSVIAFGLLCLQFSVVATVFGVLYNQEVLGFSPIIAGLYSLPGTIPVMFMAPLGGRLNDRYGSYLPIKSGILIVGLGLLWTAITVPYQNYLLLLPGGILVGSGFPLFLTPLFSLALSRVERRYLGITSGVLNAVRQFGTTSGLAFASLIVIHKNRIWLHQLTQNAGINIAHLSDLQLDNLLTNLMHNQTITGILPDQVMKLYEVAKLAFSYSYSYCLYITVFICALALISVNLVFKKIPLLRAQ